MVYRHRKWTLQPELKSKPKLFVFHIVLTSLEKICIQLFSLHLNYWADSALYGNWSRRRKTEFKPVTQMLQIPKKLYIWIYKRSRLNLDHTLHTHAHRHIHTHIHTHTHIHIHTLTFAHTCNELFTIPSQK